jgi:hypothetical protein
MTNKQAHRLVTFLIGLSVTQDTKLEHARKQTLKNATEFVEHYNEKMEDLSIEFCSVNDKGHIMKDQNNERVFTKENLRALNGEVKKFLNSELTESFKIVSTSDKKGLSEIQTDYLLEVGFLIGDQASC